MKLSDNEEKLLAVLREGELATSTELIERRYGRRPPFNARQLFNTEMRNLSRKLDYINCGLRIIKGPRRGPHPTTFKLVAKRERVDA